jgi:hypothetical protein
MSHFKSTSNRLLVVLPLFAAMFLSACSDDNSSKEAITNNATVAKTIVGNNKNMTANTLDDTQHYKQMSKPVDKANWVEKGKFKKEFTKDCITREEAIAEGGKVDLAYIEKTCACIADYMDNKLTDQEADEYLKEDNHVQSFKMRYDAGAYECVQESQKVAEPKITRFQ